MKDANFFDRLRKYYSDIAKVLGGTASAASIFPNATDVGQSREYAYINFLKQHVPLKCDVLLGGFLFGVDGSETGQVDIIVTTDTAPRFNFLNPNGNNKSFAPVDGTIGVAWIKSYLDKKELINALEGIAKIPAVAPLPLFLGHPVEIDNYVDWPYKIIYATDGLSWETMTKHMEEFYRDNPQIPLERTPNVIHVLGKYFLVRGKKSLLPNGTVVPPVHGEFVAYTNEPDYQALTHVAEVLRDHVTLSQFILARYDLIWNNMARHIMASTDGK